MGEGEDVARQALCIKFETIRVIFCAFVIFQISTQDTLVPMVPQAREGNFL